MWLFFSLGPCSPSLLLLPFGPLPSSALFPYTTLFRSPRRELLDGRGSGERRRRDDQPRRDRGVPGRDPPLGHRGAAERSEEHTSELQSRGHLVCRLLLE